MNTDKKWPMASGLSGRLSRYEIELQKDYFMKLRTILTIILALAGIGVMAFYSWCDTSCSYLKGDIFGLDLKYLGVAFMAAIIILVLCRQTDMVRIMLAGSLGREVILVAFQFREDVFCPFCLAFGLILVVSYLLNYERPQTKNHWGLKFLAFAGEAKIPFLHLRVPLLIIILLGYLFMSFTFNGSIAPSYSKIADPPVSGKPLV